MGRSATENNIYIYIKTHAHTHTGAALWRVLMKRVAVQWAEFGQTCRMHAVTSRKTQIFVKIKSYKFRSGVRTPDAQEQSLPGQQQVTQSSPVWILAVMVRARHGHDNRRA